MVNRIDRLADSLKNPSNLIKKHSLNDKEKPGFILSILVAFFGVYLSDFYLKFYFLSSALVGMYSLGQPNISSSHQSLNFKRKSNPNSRIYFPSFV